ncbi:MAG: tetratricopeptide repeat protein [Nostoc sp.]|uniref:tetratricopeptide repeat protein n=1 Tax=Nostoc sp. TaxID=1180 RepID=UPI002FFB3140
MPLNFTFALSQQGKASNLSSMARVIAQQGDIPKAIALWEQSLEIQQQIGDVVGEAATLNNMAGVIADQGDIARAIALLLMIFVGLYREKMR